jgi:hypothetical protein
MGGPPVTHDEQPKVLAFSAVRPAQIANNMGVTA